MTKTDWQIITDHLKAVAFILKREKDNSFKNWRKLTRKSLDYFLNH